MSSSFASRLSANAKPFVPTDFVYSPPRQTHHIVSKSKNQQKKSIKKQLPKTPKKRVVQGCVYNSTLRDDEQTLKKCWYQASHVTKYPREYSIFYNPYFPDMHVTQDYRNRFGDRLNEFLGYIPHASFDLKERDFGNCHYGLRTSGKLKTMTKPTEWCKTSNEKLFKDSQNAKQLKKAYNSFKKYKIPQYQVKKLNN